MRNNVNVINIRGVRRIECKTPDDLLSFKEFAEKHNMKIGYLYKLYSRGKFERHKRGVWKISESEVLNALAKVV